MLCSECAGRLSVSICSPWRRIPFNELNRVLDLGFKPLPWGGAGFVPSSLQKLGETAPDPAKGPGLEK